MNARQYTTEVLEPYLLPFLQQLPKHLESQDSNNITIIPEIKYEVMEDYSGPHRAGPTTQQYQQYAIQKSRWPSYSPDLNPIEYCWHMLKVRLKKRWKRHRKPKSQAAWIEAAQEEQELINWEKIYAIIESMPRRLQAVIDANGGRTKYQFFFFFFTAYCSDRQFLYFH